MRRSCLTGRWIGTGTGLALAACLAACLAAAAAAQAPVALERLSEIPMGNLNAVALAGDRAYVGLGPRLLVLDAGAAEGLRLLGQGSTLADDVLELAVDPARPDRLWAAAGEAGVLPLDVGDPARPQLLGRLPGYAGRLRTIGGRVYALGVGSTLRILEPDGAEVLRELGRVELPIEAFDVEGDLVWLAVGPAGLVAYDIADPARPRPVGALDTPGSAHDIQVQGGLAFVADGGRRLSVVDLMVPEAPALIGTLDVDLSGEQQCADPVTGDCGLDTRRILVEGRRLVLVLWRYLGAFSGRSAARMVLVDVADPRAPREIARRSFDLADPRAPKPVAQAPRAVYGSHYGSAEIRDLVVDEGGARLVRGSQRAGFLGQLDKARQPGRPQNGCSPPPRTEWFHRIASDGRRDYLLDQADGLPDLRWVDWRYDNDCFNSRVDRLSPLPPPRHAAAGRPRRVTQPRA